jgi:DNA-binding MarR family transcriptional regulator
MAPEPRLERRAERVADLAGSLRVTIGLFVRRLRQLPNDGELTLSQSSALARLERGGPTTAATLAKQEQISAQSMGAILGALEERGFVERRPDPGDGRRVVVSISDAGVRTLWSRRSAKTERLTEALSNDFTPEERERLLAVVPLLERLAQRI